MDKRSLFQWSRTFSRSLKKGQDYRELPNVIAINIVNFDYLDTKGYHNCFRLRDEKERDIILTGALEIHFINMVRYRRLRKEEKLHDPLCRWLIKKKKNSPPKMVEEVLKMDSAIQAAHDRLDFIAGDDDAMDLYRRRFMAMCDRTSEMNYARDEGHRIGLAEGHAEGLLQCREEIARSALAEGASIEFVQKITGLDIEDLKKWPGKR
jgi:predicted transposase/invertase (TIGR01784 family)